MDKRIEKIIEEKFASKAQQRFFYAKANDDSLPKDEQKDWKKWAKEYSDDTNFDKIPEKAPEEQISMMEEQITYKVLGFGKNQQKISKIFNSWEKVKEFANEMYQTQGTTILVVGKLDDGTILNSMVYRYNPEKKVWYVSSGKNPEGEVDEIVDKDGNIQRGDKPGDIETKGITQKSTTDKVVKTGTGQMGNTFGFGFAGGRSGSAKTLRYWAEADMSKSLGYEDTMGKDEDMEDAEDHFENELGVDDEETKDRLAQMGYDKNLPDDKIRLVENPLKYIEEYLESILPKKTKLKDVLEKGDEDGVLKNTTKNLNPIIRRQIKALLNTSKNNNVSKEMVLKYIQELEDNE